MQGGGLPKQRLGRNNDGGYVVVSDGVGSYDLLLSAGIGGDDSFECDFLRAHPNVDAVCLDGSIAAMPSAFQMTHKRLTFVSEHAGRDLADYLVGVRDVFLKMDIEGQEFEVLDALLQREATMLRIKQLVVEFHHLTPDTTYILRKLTATHTLCHLHPNNAGGLKMVEDVWIPEYFECTYLRNVEFTMAQGNTPKEREPPLEDAGLDMPNCPNKPDLTFINKIDPMAALLTEALHLEDEGDSAGALAVYNKMITSHPGDVSAHANAGLLLAKMGRRDDAIRSMRRAVDGSGNTLRSILIALCDLMLEQVFDLLEKRETKAALEVAESALQVGWELEPPWVALGLSAIACKLTMRYLPYVRTAVAGEDDHWPILRKVLFVMLADAHRYVEALEMSKTVESWDGPALSAMAVTLMHFGRCVDAHAMLSRLSPDIKNGELINLEAGALVELGEVNLAMETYAQAKPGTAVNPNVLLISNASDVMSNSAVFALHLQWAAPFDLLERISPALIPPSGRARIGYIGSDFNEHAVCHFVHGLLTRYDRDRFEVNVYDSQQSEPGSQNKVKTSIIATATHYENISTLSDTNAAATIAAAGLDILVDLASHTAGSRMGIVARKPARILACMVGYPNTTGLRCADYRLTDNVTDPREISTDRFHTETLVRVPGCMLCYKPRFFEGETLPEIVERTNGGSGIRFGCFAKPYKISDSVWRLWDAVLRAAPPGSTLTLKARSFSNSATTTRFLARVAALGFNTAPIRLTPHTSDHDTHLRAFNMIDVSLDTFPYSGTTITCDSLLMGVPVLTLLGTSHRQNVSASILVHAGMPDGVCRTPAEYVVRATSRPPERKADVRARFLQSPVCAEAAYVNKIEDHFFQRILGAWSI